MNARIKSSILAAIAALTLGACADMTYREKATVTGAAVGAAAGAAITDSTAGAVGGAVVGGVVGNEYAKDRGR